MQSFNSSVSRLLLPVLRNGRECAYASKGCSAPFGFGSSPFLSRGVSGLDDVTKSRTLAEEGSYFRSKEREALESIRKYQMVAEQLAVEAETRSKGPEGEDANTKAVFMRALQFASAAIPREFGLPPTAFPPQRAAVSALLDQARRKAATELIDKALEGLETEGGTTGGAAVLRRAKISLMSQIPGPAQSFAASEILQRAQALAQAKLSRNFEEFDLSKIPLKGAEKRGGPENDSPLRGEGVVSFESFLPPGSMESIHEAREEAKRAQAMGSLVLLIGAVGIVLYLVPLVLNYLGFSQAKGPVRDRTVTEDEVAEQLINGGTRWIEDPHFRDQFLRADLDSVTRLKGKIPYREWKAMKQDVEGALRATGGGTALGGSSGGQSSSETIKTGGWGRWLGFGS